MLSLGVRYYCGVSTRREGSRRGESTLTIPSAVQAHSMDTRVSQLRNNMSWPSVIHMSSMFLLFEGCKSTAKSANQRRNRDSNSWRDAARVAK